MQNQAREFSLQGGYELAMAEEIIEETTGSLIYSILDNQLKKRASHLQFQTSQIHTHPFNLALFESYCNIATVYRVYN